MEKDARRHWREEGGDSRYLNLSGKARVNEELDAYDWRERWVPIADKTGSFTAHNDIYCGPKPNTNHHPHRTYGRLMKACQEIKRYSRCYRRKDP